MKALKTLATVSNHKRSDGWLQITPVDAPQRMSLRGQRVVALGGTSGIGLAVVQSALTEGARVVVAANGQSRVEEVGAELASRSPGSEAQRVDVADEHSIERFFERIGRFDHLAWISTEANHLTWRGNGFRMGFI